MIKTLSTIDMALSGLVLLSMTLPLGCSGDSSSDAGSKAGTMTPPTAGTMPPGSISELDALRARLAWIATIDNDGNAMLCEYCMDREVVDCSEESKFSIFAEEAACILDVTTTLDREPFYEFLICMETHYTNKKSCASSLLTDPFAMDCSIDHIETCKPRPDTCIKILYKRHTEAIKEVCGTFPISVFFCDNGDSITGEWACDGEPDCEDSSDEMRCMP